ncbi:NADPH2:quinone reductase [Cladophialophora psammophila CBS 110553]|uniref:NADPH2:quinone reductase n=1 Tax=Cladophialophora psammophila CBS 110553 TaxID=1182543 RepID=W9WUP7_9EURO|nr:NADPH2:quinone reductase [Cladophialophora psammophila CBS 110553]EXJ71698.1 NADPH2:quinone reductase [Cladophialophora psammophila CBS 110553]
MIAVCFHSTGDSSVLRVEDDVPVPEIKDDEILVKVEAGRSWNYGTVSTEQNAEIAKQHGCDHVIDFREQSVLSQVLKLTGGKGCHAVLSGIGKSTFTDDLAATRIKDTLMSYGSNSIRPVTDFNLLDLSKKNVKVVRPNSGKLYRRKRGIYGKGLATA